jgi:hypothetical protein
MFQFLFELGTMFDLFAGNLTRQYTPASSWRYRFAFAPEGLHLDPHPAWGIWG